MNHKRVERLYAEAELQVKRRKCTKIPVGECQPLFRPENEERPKKALGGLTPAAYTRQLAMKTVTVTLGL